MKVTRAFKHTDTGHHEYNEDSSLLTLVGKTHCLVAAVADGVGGLSAGDIASGFVTESLKAWVDDNADDIFAANTDELKNILDEAVKKINKSLSIIAREKECGSTLSLVVINKNTYVICQIGDSRVYLCQGNECRQLTKDQTLLQSRLDKGESLNDIEVEKFGRIILQCMGMEKINPTYYEGILEDDYQMIICSDGMSNTLDTEELKELLLANPGSRDILANLKNLARSRNEQDDITGIYIGKVEK